MKELKPNVQRGKIAIALIWIILVITIISAISDYLQYELLKRFAAGETVFEEELTTNDLRQQILGVLLIIISIISAVTFLRWFRRAYCNLGLKVGALDSTDVWVVSSWFIPIVNLFQPYRIMRELYKKTDRYLLAQNDERYTERLETNYLPAWWALWLINGFGGNISVRSSLNAETIDQMVSSSILGIICSVISIILALVTIIVITDYNKIEGLIYDLGDNANETPDIEELLPELEG